jgi:NADH:ubiquinone oxidoreductase subunit C
VTFDHHPDLRHLLTPDGYVFHPLLRSFKLHEPEELEVKSRHV